MSDRNKQSGQGEEPSQELRGMSVDHDAERGLLGCLLTYPERMDDVVEILRGDESDFDDTACAITYGALMALWRAGEPIDLVITVDKLRQMGRLDEAGGIAGVSQLINAAPPPDRLEKYARIIRSLAGRRADIKAGLYLAREAMNCENDEAYTIIRRGVGDQLSDDLRGQKEDLPILADDEAEALPALKGILGDILFDESVSYLYGPSGRWKSFVALDWSMCIATETPWMGRPVQGGDVLYVCSEGARGIGKRITAWKRRHGMSGRTRLRIMPLSIDLTNAAQVAALPRRLESLDIQPVLIVFDTLAASNSGDENTSDNANRITTAARHIIRAHEGVCVLIVHHTGYDNTHMRGSTAFFSGADTVIRIEGGDANRRIEPGEPITLISDKPKEGEPFQDIVLTAERQTWADEEGTIHASLVMVSGDAIAAAAKVSKALDAGMTSKRKAALAILEAASDDGLGATAWLRASGLSHGAFYEAISFFLKAKMIGINGIGNYYCLSASPVVRSGPVSGPVGGPVRSGVSIDTGRTGLAGLPDEHIPPSDKSLRERPGYYGKLS